MRMAGGVREPCNAITWRMCKRFTISPDFFHRPVIVRYHPHPRSVTNPERVPLPYLLVIEQELALRWNFRPTIRIKHHPVYGCMHLSEHLDIRIDPIVIRYGSLDQQGRLEHGIGRRSIGGFRRLQCLIPVVLHCSAMNGQTAGKSFDRREQSLLKPDHEQSGGGLDPFGDQGEPVTEIPDRPVESGLIAISSAAGRSRMVGFIEDQQLPGSNVPSHSRILGIGW